jgi:hypothetical protein
MPFRVKSFILLIISCLVVTVAPAQTNSSFVGIRFGAVLPMGEMASHEFGYGGYALLGKSFGGETAWFINPKIGFGIDVSFNSFDFASGYYAEDYKQSEPAFSSVDLLSGPYKIATYMGGAYYKVEIIPRFHSTFKVMGGFFRASTPDQFYGVTSFFVDKLYFWKTSSTDSRLTFLTGASFEYELYEHVSVLLQADFTYAQMGFKFYQGNTSYIDHMHMPVFRLQPGINIRF